jgi:hypothetical protein
MNFLFERTVRQLSAVTNISIAAVKFGNSVTPSGGQVLKKGQMAGPHCPDIKRVRKELRKKKNIYESQVGCTAQSQNNSTSAPPSLHYSNCGNTRNIQGGAQVPRVNVLKIECQVSFATLYILK